MKKRDIQHFQKTVYQAFRERGRSFPWRDTRNPYRILVSEIMLQQTQAGPRTVEKYHAFLETFPTIQTLAAAPLSDVLRLWQGLGYNRRAKALRDTARIIVKEHKGKVPADPQMLVPFPGIGPYTAAAVCTFAYNKPLAFIETNIRVVYIHFFFSRRRTPVSDNEIMPLVEETLDTENPREWYCALMDYGALLKKKHLHLNKKSKHYARQSTFEGSDRQIRGKLIKVLTKKSAALSPGVLAREIQEDLPRVREQLQRLAHEEMLVEHKGVYSI